jgi:hypothetical protein
VKSVEFLARHICDNVVRFLGIIESWSLLAIPIAVVAIRRMVKRENSVTRTTILGTIAAAMLYGSGFMPLLLEARYFWILYALILLITLGLFDESEGIGMRRRAAALLFALVVLSFAIRPLLPRRFDEQGLIARRQADDLQRQRVDLSGHRLASNRNWEATLYINYYVGAHYYGTPKPGQNAAEIRRELDRNRIDAFVLWGGIAPPYLTGFRRAAVSNHAFVLYTRTEIGGRT